jgi:hypothetical protein
VLYDALH